MDFKKVVGTRRSVRWFKPWKPVEREKIEVILQAARWASRSMNADYPRAVVVMRDELPAEVLEALHNPTTAADVDLAPVYIFWYFDMEYVNGVQDRLKQLVDQHALSASHGWSYAYIDNHLWPQVLKQIAEEPIALMFMGATETGIAICNALNAAVDQGLGTCLHSFINSSELQKVLGVPPTWIPVWMQLVGYPLEDPEAGGQRPRSAMGDMYFEGSCDKPWREDPEVTGQLQRDGMIQEPGPLPWREQEVKMLTRMFGLPE